MEDLKKNLGSSQQYIFQCSQCNKNLNSTLEDFYCKNCKSQFCDVCLKNHNQVFFDHEVVKSADNLEFLIEANSSSLLANPDNDLDDRMLNISDSDIEEEDKKLQDINFLFTETITNIQENFNEEFCKFKEKINKDKNDKSENKIKEYDLNFNVDKLKQLPPLERIKIIMEIITLKKYK